MYELRNIKVIAVGGLLATTAAITGCSKDAPSGQVAAVVNGKEVTLQEINAELQASNIPASADKKTVQRELLQRIIERKLLVDAATEKGIDKTPEYQTQKRRADELLLVQLYAKQQLTAVPVPSTIDISNFMAQHANVFGQRQQLSLDQIRFPTQPDLQKLKTLEKDHTLDAVGQTLTGMGIKFERSQVGLDTGSVPTDIMKKIDSLPQGEPFVIPQPGFITVNVILSRRPLPVDEAKAKPAAVNAWRQEKFGELLTKQIEALKAGAKISYQNGFGAPAKGAPSNVPPMVSGAPTGTPGAAEPAKP
ncbi:MAG: peptidyl-prolyl cis-trans isomerase, EpsD family [Sphingomonas sp.]|nr:MAG: peptidyl-prolyl cis-trans isomerase, EpsD family [Sphingomonas sp.]